MHSFSFTIFIFGRYTKVKGVTKPGVDVLEMFGWCIAKNYPIWYAE
jgi:hypothetical protein